jgi:hypothetical protein
VHTTLKYENISQQKYVDTTVERVCIRDEVFLKRLLLKIQYIITTLLTKPDDKNYEVSDGKKYNFIVAP